MSSGIHKNKSTIPIKSFGTVRWNITQVMLPDPPSGFLTRQRSEKRCRAIIIKLNNYCGIATHTDQVIRHSNIEHHSVIVVAGRRSRCTHEALAKIVGVGGRTLAVVIGGAVAADTATAAAAAIFAVDRLGKYYKQRRKIKY